MFLSHLPYARAGIEEVAGVGLRSQSMAGAAVALDKDTSATYYNPAGLSGIRFNDDIGFNLELGLSTFDMDAYTEHSVYGKNTHNEIKPLTTINFNLAMDFGRHLRDYIGARNLIVGISVLLPTDNFAWWRIQFPEEEIYTFYYDHYQHFLTVIGFGMDITSWLSIGVSLNVHLEVLFDSYGDVDLDTDMLNDIVSGMGEDSSETVVDVSSELGAFCHTMTKVSPIYGIQVKPFSRFMLGITYREELYMDDYGKNIITANLSSGNTISLEIPFRYDHHFAHFYAPDQLALGVSYRFANGLLIASDVTFMEWSTFLNIQHQRPEESFEDVVIPKIGVEKPVLKKQKLMGNLYGDFILRAGYSFWDSPVPEQKGRTNYLDTDKHVWALGCELAMDHLGKRWQKPTSIQAMIQYHQMVDRTYHKEATGETLDLGGHAYHTGITVEVKF